MISNLFDFFARKRKDEQLAEEKAISPTLVVDRTGVMAAVSGLDKASNLAKAKDAVHSRALSPAAMANLKLNQDYHFCGGKYIKNGVRLLKPAKELVPVNIIYNGYLSGCHTVKLRKGEGNNESWENVQNMDMVKTEDGYHVASILVNPAKLNNGIHKMHLAFYTDNNGQINWDNNKGQNFSFEIPVAVNGVSAKNSMANNTITSHKSSNIINNLLGIHQKNNGSK